MKTIIIGLILLGSGIVGGYYFWSSAPVKNVPLRSTGPILFFGDSLVEGVGATRGHDLPALLSNTLGEPVLNFGVAGDTTRQALARVRSVQAEHPRLVLILLGGNDFLQKVPRDETFANLRSIITIFQSDGAATMLVGVRSGIIGGGADDRYAALAEETESLYIEDVLQGVFGDPTLMSDAIHPNDAGYRKIADRIAPIIQSLIDTR
jgi:lysophospholipase L1-like esterase